jgi:D-alanyl-lipoteichoic acid acyltransferase DltB (MBOAT superfamily)
MLFNSFVFLFCFLPVVLAGHRLILGAGRPHLAVLFLAGASFFFYGWWSPASLPIFLGSISVNYAIGMAIRRARMTGAGGTATRWLWAGVSFNLGLLCYFKYLGFLAGSIRSITGLDLPVPEIELPIGISFYSFTQLAFLVDHWRHPIEDKSLSRYSVFVSFFPHLVAGPIIHHRDIMPQFERQDFRKPPFPMVAAGLALLAVGLFKKCAVADNLAPVAGALFDAVGDGARIKALEAWVGVLAYTMQIYFDFSGYSDMAVGIGYLFGIRFPINFWSPYQARSIIDFWRRWHITLSQFLRDYLYIPLGGNRFGELMRYRNLILTMLLGGLWHGANWTFVIWGALHGSLLAANHLWEAHRPKSWPSLGLPGIFLSRVATFLFVCLAWVFFRSDTPRTAWSLIGLMAGSRGGGLPEGWDFAGWCRAAEIEPVQAALLIGAILLAHCCPNSAAILLGLRVGDKGKLVAGDPAARGVFAFRPTWPWAVTTGLILLIALWFGPEVSEFIYFQF